MANIDDQIRKAIESGQFDNLPGKGKPLRLDENAFEDPDWRMANHILKNAGFSLPWIEKRAEILAEVEANRQKLNQVWEWKSRVVESQLPSSEVEAEWLRAIALFRQNMADLDSRIRDLNLEVAHARFQLARLKIDKEIEAVCRATRLDSA